MASTQKTLSVATPDADLLEWLLDDIGADRSSASPVARFSDHELVFELPTESGEPGGLDKADVLVGLVRFVDLLTLQQMEELLRPASTRGPLAVAILIYRNEGEEDFKMSCPYCGQKLWVRDVDVDKRGRCPHCRKGFTLPKQEEHVRAILKLPASVPVHRVQRNDAGSISSPLRRIRSLKKESVLDHLGIHFQASNQTMNVDVEE